MITKFKSAFFKAQKLDFNLKKYIYTYKYLRFIIIKFSFN